MFLIKKSKGDPSVYLNKRFGIHGILSRFNQRNDIFNRAMWDEKVKPKNFFQSYDIANYAPKKAKGFDHWDYALRNASWHLTDVVGEWSFDQTGKVEGFTDYYSIQTPGPKGKAPVLAKAEQTARIKQAAKTLGAGTVGICALDERWVYSHRYNRKTDQAEVLDLPASLRYAILLVVPMDYVLSKTIPSAIGGTTTGLGYATCLNAANALAQFITNLGYEALASMNDTALNIPMAIQAGLGEYGRNGLLITPEYGPNVRIAKVFTDMELVPDQPIEFGVQAFCNTCRKCADACPVRAISQDAPKVEAPNFSSLTGVKKWTVNAEKCFRFWVGMNTDCAICIRVCPYNKDYSKWWHRWGIRLANSPLRRLMRWLDDRLGYGKRQAPETWWAPSGEVKK
jgi:reductive dehalogenase